jgi:hypothetical protein
MPIREREKTKGRLQAREIQPLLALFERDAGAAGQTLMPLLVTVPTAEPAKKLIHV